MLAGTVAKVQVLHRFILQLCKQVLVRKCPDLDWKNPIFAVVWRQLNVSVEEEVKELFEDV